MSLQDESFPADEISDRLNNTKGSLSLTLQRQFSIHLNTVEPDDLAGNDFVNSALEKVCAANSVDYKKNKEGETKKSSAFNRKNKCNFCTFRNKQ